MPRLLGNGPLEYTRAGKQFLIPLSEVSVGPTGDVKFVWPPFAGFPQSDRDALTALVKGLIGQGVLVADTAAPPQPSVVVKAKEAGPAGNSLTVKFANVVADPNAVGDSTFDVTVSESDAYPLLSIDQADTSFAGKVLGQKGGKDGTKPGLLIVTSVAGTKAPAPANYTLDPTAGQTVDLLDAANATSLTLEPRQTQSAGGAKIVIQVTPGAGPGTFGLSAALAVSKNVKLSGLLAATDFADFVTFEAPDGGAKLTAVPTAGAVQLTGGTSAAPAQSATASVVAGP
jgi:hypothetical protein